MRALDLDEEVKAKVEAEAGDLEVTGNPCPHRMRHTLFNRDAREIT